MSIKSHDLLDHHTLFWGCANVFNALTCCNELMWQQIRIYKGAIYKGSPYLQ